MIRIVETDGDVVELAATTLNGEIQIITVLERVGRDIILRGMHVDGPGAGSLGLQTLRNLAREFGKQHSAERVIIHGGTRTTGANPGRVPLPIVILVGE